MIVSVLQGQSWYDVALIHTGQATNAAVIALANDAQVSSMPVGSVVIPNDIMVDRNVVAFFNKQITKPATYEEL